MAKLSSVFDDAHIRKYPKGQIILYEGEKTQDVFQIRKGHVKVYDVNAQGNEKLMLILGPEDIFPLIWTFSGTDSLHYFYETFDEAEVCVIPKSQLVASINQNHQTTIHLLEYFVDRTQDLMNRIDCIDATSAKHKVAQVLSYLAAAHGEKITKGAYKIRIQITHQAVADMAGITRETASLQLKEIEAEKMYRNDKEGMLVHTDRIDRFLET